MRVRRAISIGLMAAAPLLAACTSSSSDEEAKAAPIGVHTLGAQPRAKAAPGAAMPEGYGPGMYGPGMMGARGGGGHMMGAACPAQVPGASASATNVEGGAALTFSSYPARVAAVRKGVRHLATIYSWHSGGRMMWGAHGRGGPGMSGAMMGGGLTLPAASATVEETESGARIVLKPEDPAQLRRLRKQTRVLAERLAGGQCPMMGWEAGPAFPPKEQ